jgi:type IX secretion system PorP/SprF family membrane protein
MKIRFTIITILAFACLQTASAQDPQFLQFYNSPLQLNPAMTGVYPGKWRVVANYREQWNSILDNKPYRSMSASFDMRMPVTRGDFLALGVTALHDRAGMSNYTRAGGDLSLSFMKQLDGGRYRSSDQYLIAGAQVGMGQHSLDYQNLWFSSQWRTDIEQVDQTLSNLEGIDENSGVFVNINAGLMWYAVFDENQSFYVGGALHHVNQPKVSFIAAGGEGTLEMKWTAHLGGELPLSRELSLLPAAAVMGQGASLFSIFGTNIRYTNRDWKELAVRIGAWGHLSKDFESGMSLPAVTFTGILEVERWNIGLSYDVNANKLSAPTNGRGAFEFSLIYYQPATRKERVNCPKM